LHGQSTQSAGFHFPDRLHFEGMTITNDLHGTSILSFQSTNLFQDETPTLNTEHPTPNDRKLAACNTQLPSILILHGDQDGVFPVADTARVAAVFRTNGVPVELKVLPGQSHGFNPSRGTVLRALGEFCLTRLRGAEALGQYRSIGVWQGAAWPLWVWWLPALAWGGGWLAVRWRAESRKQKAESGERGNNLLGGLARGGSGSLGIGGDGVDDRASRCTAIGSE
jgi:acetyl esterase/lipase